MQSWMTSLANLTGFSAAIEAVFPRTEIQNCIIHQLRNSTKYVSYKDIKALVADLKMIYTAVDETGLTGECQGRRLTPPPLTCPRYLAIV